MSQVRPVPATDTADDSRISQVLDAADVTRTLDRLAHQIIENTAHAPRRVLMGIPSRGAPLASRIRQRIADFGGGDIPAGVLDITLFRDDLRRNSIRPLAETVEPAGGIDGALVVLVDDVLFSGRTIRAALDALTELGRPAGVQLAVLVDRGHRQLPIRADYVGKNLPTDPRAQVRVSLQETDGADGVAIVEPRDNR
ncbi:MAG: bifunctional pyr operon transcriptional regulator/uracil phosphoribosyltransferase PyrR [Jatrophihabitans sp.]